MRRLAVLAVALALGAACSGDDDGAGKIRASPQSTTTEPPADRYREPQFTDVDVTRDLVYGSAPGVDGAPEELTLDLYVPADDEEHERPAVIFAHGGGFAAGDKSEGVSSILAPEFATLGYVTASINYRLLAPPGCSGSNTDGGCSGAAIEGIHDGQAAVRWLRANAETYGIDAERIAIAGESAGGVMATGAGTWADVPGASGTPGLSSQVQAWMALSGGLPGCLFASPGDAPGILFASTGDRVVPHQWSVDCRDKLTEVGVDVELVSYELDVHVPFRERRDDIVQRTVDFFYEHLVGSRA